MDIIHAPWTIPGNLQFTAAVSKIIPGATSLSIRNNGDTQDNLFIADAGLLCINDNANANMTIGLTINQGAADNAILALKSSDVAHGITTQAETDTYGFFRKNAGDTGGLDIIGLGETYFGLMLFGYAVSDDTTKTTGGTGYITLSAGKKAATTVGGCGADANLLVIRDNASARFIFDAEGQLHCVGASYTDIVGNGHWFINDTADTNCTVGLTINQGAADDMILTFKSSDVAHGMTDIIETDTYGFFGKQAATAGGLAMRAMSTGTIAIRMTAYGATDDTAKATTADGYFNIYAAKKSGVTAGDCGANANLLVVRNNATTRFILDADGDSHQDVGTAWTNFDEHDDVALLAQLSHGVSRDEDRVRLGFGEFLAEHRDRLQQLKLVAFNDGPGQDGHPFVNMSKLAMLLVGAVRQLGQRLEIAESRLAALPPAP